MYRRYSKHVARICLLAGLLGYSSCDESDNFPPGAFIKQSKKLVGTWRIQSVTRNGTDLTDRFDFSQFAITFATTGDGSGTYTITHKAPFPVGRNGTWKFDDPAYPFAIALTEEGTTSLKIVELRKPVIYDKPQLTLRFSSGCSGNTYEYILNEITQ